MIYRAARACVTRPEYLRRLIGEVVEDAAADGVVWVQPHFDPFAYPEFGPAAQVLELALTAGREAGVRHGVGFGLTLAAMRHHGPDAAVDLARFAGRHAGRGVHAFGLAGNEAVFPIEPFAAAFAIARDAGLTAAPHAGEMAGPGSVRAAVHRLGARRIAHGIRAIEDPGTVELLRRRGSAWTSARPRTTPSGSSRPWPTIRYGLCSTPVSRAHSAPTIRCCSAPACSASTKRRGPVSA